MKFNIPILMYHQIRDIKEKEHLSSLAVSPGSFRRQMKMLNLMGYKGVSLTELAPYLSGEKRKKVAGITFDDGYLNNLTHALPVLDQLDFTATCYIVTERMGKTNDWNLRLSQQPLMTKEQIHEWINSGMEIGSHTLTHVKLGEVDAATAEHEIVDSKNGLEDIFGTSVHHFCYPFGSVNDHAMKTAQKAGYITAVTTERSRCTDHEDLFRLPRVVVARQTLPHLFWMKIATGYEDKKRKR